MSKKEPQYSFDTKCVLIGGPYHGEIVTHEFGNFVFYKGANYKISYVLIDEISYPVGIFLNKGEL